MTIPTALTISSVLTCRDPVEKLLLFLDDQWELYDGVTIPRDDTITLFDLLLSTMVNSRLDTASKIRRVWQSTDGRRATEAALGLIPPRSSLLDDVVPWETLTDLFDAFTTIPGVQAAVATKILYKKRPDLIPMVDSVMTDYFLATQQNIPSNRTSLGVRLVANMRCFRDQLLGCREEIEALCALTGERGYPISPVRALEVLIWIEREPKGYYRAI